MNANSRLALMQKPAFINTMSYTYVGYSPCHLTSLITTIVDLRTILTCNPCHFILGLPLLMHDIFCLSLLGMQVSSTVFFVAFFVSLEDPFKHSFVEI